MKPPQRSSRQPAKNYCGTDVSPQSPPEFFKVYIPAFHSHQLVSASVSLRRGASARGSHRFIVELGSPSAATV
ncbi:hypothetical protein MLD38_032215 [Melastoma candidum]|uniref:Uncharacterized protein n=1 Tax=Melastoma candidum TaxID=119954 RepID=A0ACB9M2Z1_9MYRT|nr:hypothetical protein MLD38_032215 [Melastoma candidum]